MLTVARLEQGHTLIGRRWLALLMLSAIISVISPRVLAGSDLQISLANNSEAERATRERLLALVAEHDVSAWIETREVLIDENAIPHSHPVLTVHTRHLYQPDQLLSTFLHEQFHWLMERNEAARDRAIAHFLWQYQDAPSGRPDGARDRYSTYLHLIVCDLEFQAMVLLVGEQRARVALSAYNHYPWIYQQVLSDPAVRKINARFGFLLDDTLAPPGTKDSADNSLG